MARLLSQLGRLSLGSWLCCLLALCLTCDPRSTLRIAVKTCASAPRSESNNAEEEESTGSKTAGSATANPAGRGRKPGPDFARLHLPAHNSGTHSSRCLSADSTRAVFEHGHRNGVGAPLRC